MTLSPKASGFTLAEIMVTMSIFTLLITAFYSGTNNTFQNRANIRDEISAIQTLFANARNMAITSTGVSEEGSTTTVVPQYGYGVHMYAGENLGVYETTFTLFADTEIDDNETPDDFTDDEFGWSSGDIILSEYSAFEKGVASGVQTEVAFFELDGSERIETVKSDGTYHEMTLLFTPLNANPIILFDNDSGDTDYQGVTLNFFASNLIEEEIQFKSISRFFERVRVCPSTGATPANCSTYSTL